MSAVVVPNPQPVSNLCRKPRPIVEAMNEIHPAARFFSAGHPINEFLSFEIEEAGKGRVILDFTASDSFILDPATGEVHSGLATLVLDMIMGSTVMGELEEIKPIATAGLTTQHMRRPKGGEKLRCATEFQGIHADLAHVSAKLTAQDSGEVLSTATGTFMVGTRSKPLGYRV